jgi:hypothetical protein
LPIVASEHAQGHWRPNLQSRLEEIARRGELIGAAASRRTEANAPAAAIS